MMQEQAPNTFDNLDAIIIKDDFDNIQQVQKLAGFFPETLIKRPSLSV
jgi:hypothetical protein